MFSLRFTLAVLGLLLSLALAQAQAVADRQASAFAAPADTGLVRLPPGAPASAARSSVREAANRSAALRLLVSVEDRRLWLVQGRDTVFRAPVAVGTGRLLRHGTRAWRFETPRGVRRVLSKQQNPVWVPPDWHYAELAADSGWALVPLQRGAAIPLPDGRRLEVRGKRVGVVLAGGGFEPVPEDEEVVFGTTLYVPPVGTANRRMPGELGAFKLDLGGGYMLHGTPHKESIGQAATHGCIRLDDDAIAYLYRNVPVGTPVYIY
jgi:L,D-transpeptidase catalytic domain